MTGVQNTPVLCDICGYLSVILAENTRLEGEVSTNIA